ncbi:MAG: hypothetical protein ABS81_00820 [Pseudonocardia sp. SCN 72-86]|nr:MAG: hypothetical protein ABS81_00820 [Pseudonocardia sp. SCN 72-86]
MVPTAGAGPVAATGPDPLPRRHPAFFVAAVALFVFAADLTAVSTALGTLASDLRVDLAWASWAVTALAAGQILALPLGGRFSDRFGGKRVFLTAVATLSVVSLLAAGVADMGQLIACRFVQGLAGGALLPAASGIVAHHYGRDRDQAVALLTSISPMGAVVGPTLGGIVLTFGSWRWIFLVLAPVGLLLTVVGAFVLREPPRGAATRVDLWGMTLIGSTLVSVMVVVTVLASIGSPLSIAVLIGALIVAVVGAWAYARHAGRHPTPVVPLALLRGGGLGTMHLVNIVFGMAVIGFVSLLPVYAEARYLILPLAASVLTASRAIGTIVFSSITAVVLRRFGARPLLMGGLGLTSVGLLLAALPPPGMAPILWLSLGSAVLGLGMGVAAPAAGNAAMHLIPDHVAAVVGLRGMFVHVGGILAVSVIASVMSAGRDPGTAAAISFAVLSALLAVTALGATRLPRHRGRW